METGFSTWSCYGASMEFERVRCVIGRGTSITNHDAGADEWRSRKSASRQTFLLGGRVLGGRGAGGRTSLEWPPQWTDLSTRAVFRVSSPESGF